MTTEQPEVTISHDEVKRHRIHIDNILSATKILRFHFTPEEISALVFVSKVLATYEKEFFEKSDEEG